MSKEPCLLSTWYNSKSDSTYVNIKDKSGITTQADLLKICWNCKSYLCCDYVLRLYTLLSVNEKK